MKKYIIFITIVIVVGFGFYKKFYTHKDIAKSTQKVVQKSVENVVHGIGNVGAENIYKIGSLYGGQIQEFSIVEGQYIKEGELIAVVDSVDLVYKIDEQKALLQKLFNDVKSLEIDKQSAKVNFDYQNELFKKNKNLFHLHSISSLDFQKYLTSKDSAKLKIDSISGHVLSLKSQTKQTQANLKGLQKRLSLYTIKAPVSGYVTKRLVTNHQIIMPNQTLVEITNPKDVWIRTFVDTRVSGKVKLGNSATIKLQSGDKVYRGKVVNINPINNPITYEREIDVRFENLKIPFYLDEQAEVKIDIQSSKKDNDKSSI